MTTWKEKLNEKVLKRIEEYKASAEVAPMYGLMEIVSTRVYAYLRALEDMGIINNSEFIQIDNNIWETK